MQFIGFKFDGSMVTNTFVTPGSGASTFTTYTFGSEFVTDLAKVEIPSRTWAMDNLVVVPEPGTVTIFIVGLGTCAGWFWRKRRR